MKALSKLKTGLLILAIINVFYSCKKSSATTTVPQPAIESVTIGTQIWTKKNLDVDHYKNGDAIPEVKDFNVWKNLKTGAWHYYDNSTDNGKIYGKLYNWYAVNDPRGLAPAGWHIPSDAEWTNLTNSLGSGAGGKMKEAGTLHWISPNTGADNSSGFNALPSGSSTSLIFLQQGYETYWWTSTSFALSTETVAIFRAVYYNGSGVNGAGVGTSLYNGFSVRCVKN